MKTISFLAACVIVALNAGAAAAETRGSWVKDKSECKYRSGERDEFAISRKSITNLEFQCDVRSRKQMNGYSVVQAVCSGEGSESVETIRYKVDGAGALHIRIGKQPEEIYRFSCGK